MNQPNTYVIPADSGDVTHLHAVDNWPEWIYDCEAHTIVQIPEWEENKAHCEGEQLRVWYDYDNDWTYVSVEGAFMNWDPMGAKGIIPEDELLNDFLAILKSQTESAKEVGEAIRKFLDKH